MLFQKITPRKRRNCGKMGYYYLHACVKTIRHFFFSFFFKFIFIFTTFPSSLERNNKHGADGTGTQLRDTAKTN